MTDFAYFADVCKKIEDIPGSLEITSLVAEMLKEVSDDELPIVTYFIMGQVFPEWTDSQLRIGTSLLYTALSKSSGVTLKNIEKLVKDTGDIGEVAGRIFVNEKKNQSTFSAFMEDQESLSIMDVFERLRQISVSNGKGSKNTKIKHLQYLFSLATPKEARYIARLAIEDLRIGVGEGIVKNSIAKAFDVPGPEVERGFMLTNDLGAVAAAARRGGVDEVSGLSMVLNRPVRMMLAQLAPGIPAVLEELGQVAIEWKFDGARVQIHKKGDEVSIFSRRLENVTASLPDIVEAVYENISADSVIIEGEAIAVDENGRPRAFQEILKRFRRKYDVESTVREIPLILKAFDILYLNGEDLINLPLSRRRAILSENVRNGKGINVDEQILTDDEAEINRVYQKALDAGHEGIMIKNPQAPYSPGKRGKNWLKKKPVMETLDLVVVGAEWGYGRRANVIGSYALACYDPSGRRYLPIGRVATGFSDEVLSDLTKLFADLIIFEEGRQIEIRPQIVFEVAFEEIQKSTNYESGYALRFPRLVNVRTDKSPEETETIERIGEIYRAQRE